MTKKELKTIAKELIECNEDYETMQEYSNALCSVDLPKIEFFKSMGETVRHQLMNVHEYRHRLNFGFTEIKFTESGWLENVEWTEYEEVEIKVCNKNDKSGARNQIRLAMGLNGKWVYSLSYWYVNGGGGWSPSVFSDPLDSKDQAYQNGLIDMAGRHKGEKGDMSKKVLAWIEVNIKTEKVANENLQLSIF